MQHRIQNMRTSVVLHTPECTKVGLYKLAKFLEVKIFRAENPVVVSGIQGNPEPDKIFA